MLAWCIWEGSPRGAAPAGYTGKGRGWRGCWLGASGRAVLEEWPLLATQGKGGAGACWLGASGRAVLEEWPLPATQGKGGTGAPAGLVYLGGQS